ncbi:hypothetical protein [Streptomyces sp. LN500]|uniref:hypothetical protein n=1 Tax=Streptomyces sp. LN500 TaxID=3112978 RepID=UPI003711BA6A
MTSGRGTLTALHLLLVWVTMTAAMPVLGFELVVTAWGGGAGAAVPVLALGVPLMVGLLAIAGIPAKTVVPLCGSVRRGSAGLPWSSPSARSASWRAWPSTAGRWT